MQYAYSFRLFILPEELLMDKHVITKSFDYLEYVLA